MKIHISQVIIWFVKTMGIMTIFLLALAIKLMAQANQNKPLIIDESSKKWSVLSTIKIDKVWAGHPVGFFLLTHENRQYIAYYNSERKMVVGQRDLRDKKFSLHVMPPTSRETHGGTSTVVGWDSHNSIVIGIDKEGYIHLSGNMHVHPITYFRSAKPYDITTLEQVMEMTGKNEKRCTYPKFMHSREGELIFHYRDGSSGNGNEIYNIWSCEKKQWSRLLEDPLTDGQGLMNAYQSQPVLLADGRYHVYWVWRDTPHCETNHDLSYMTSPDLINWHNPWGEKITLPATLENKSLIVDPIPVKGGIINLAARLCLDENNRPLFVYHKYDENGNLQLYVAWQEDNHWKNKVITQWGHRWEFSGTGSINFDVRIKSFKRRPDGYYEIEYDHIKYGDGAILLDKDLNNCGKVIKPAPFGKGLQPEGDFPGLSVRIMNDQGAMEENRTRYVLKWETLGRNRDKPREKPWPAPSQLYLYKLGLIK